MIEGARSRMRRMLLTSTLRFPAPAIAIPAPGYPVREEAAEPAKCFAGRAGRGTSPCRPADDPWQSRAAVGAKAALADLMGWVGAELRRKRHVEGRRMGALEQWTGPLIIKGILDPEDAGGGS